MFVDLLKSIDFTFPIFCILIEAHSDAQDRNKIVGNHLKSNGFTYYERQLGNEVWINKNYFRKHLFNTAESRFGWIRGWIDTSQYTVVEFRPGFVSIDKGPPRPPMYVRK